MFSYITVSWYQCIVFVGNICANGSEMRHKNISYVQILFRKRLSDHLLTGCVRLGRAKLIQNAHHMPLRQYWFHRSSFHCSPGRGGGGGSIARFASINRSAAYLHNVVGIEILFQAIISSRSFCFRVFLWLVGIVEPVALNLKTTTKKQKL